MLPHDKLKVFKWLYCILVIGSFDGKYICAFHLFFLLATGRSNALLHYK